MQIYVKMKTLRWKRRLKTEIKEQIPRQTQVQKEGGKQLNTEYSAWTQEYKKEQYSIIQTLGEHENLWLVKDCLSEKILVMRKLPLFMQEVMKELALIDHPGIVHILDVFYKFQLLQ